MAYFNYLKYFFKYIFFQKIDMEQNWNKNLLLFLLCTIVHASIYWIYTKNPIKMKVAICTMAKKENLYIKEFVDYYIKLGFSHIFIYDNNDPNDEKISDVINIKKYKDYVTIYENKSITNQPTAYTTCYNNNNKNFNWIFMIDIDEYLIIKNNKLINYLSDETFQKCDFIKIHWLQPTDNNKLHYENKSLLERFKAPYLKDTHIKTFVRGNINGLKYDIHTPSESPEKNISCNNAGQILNYPKIHVQDVFKINYDKAYIIHFKYKSTEEYIKKYKRGYSNWFDENFLPMRIEEYFKDNKVTLEKILYFEKELNLNLSRYKMK